MAKLDYGTQIVEVGGMMRDLREFEGKTLLIVNVASHCGFTPQLQALQKLQSELGPLGFQVLAFPCNQFGGQAPGTDEEQASFCEREYGTTFPIFAKVKVNGQSAASLFKQLKSGAPGLLGVEAVKWNFTKFLVQADGEIIGRFAPGTRPEKLRAAIEAALEDAEKRDATGEFAAISRPST